MLSTSRVPDARPIAFEKRKSAQNRILEIRNSPSVPKSTQKEVENPFRSKIVVYKPASFEEVCEIEEDIIEVYYGSGVSRRHSQLRRGLSRVRDGYSRRT